MVDWSRTAEDYARYRAGYPPELFERLERLGVGRAGQRVLDLGTGPGPLARPLALRGGRVVGLDPSLDALRQAQRLDEQAGVAVSYVAGRAEHVGLASGCFDVVAAGTAWQWFDGPAAAAEARRLLVAGGALVITRFMRVPLVGSLTEATERLIARHNPAWPFRPDSGIHPGWVADVEQAGFSDIETFSFDSSIPYSHEAWCGRVRASAPVGATMTAEQVGDLMTDLRDLLAASYPQQPLAVRHRTFAVVCRAP